MAKRNRPVGVLGGVGWARLIISSTRSRGRNNKNQRGKTFSWKKKDLADLSGCKEIIFLHREDGKREKKENCRMSKRGESCCIEGGTKLAHGFQGKGK